MPDAFDNEAILAIRMEFIGSFPHVRPDAMRVDPVHALALGVGLNGERGASAGDRWRGLDGAQAWAIVHFFEPRILRDGMALHSHVSGALTLFCYAEPAVIALRSRR